MLSFYIFNVTYIFEEYKKIKNWWDDLRVVRRETEQNHQEKQLHNNFIFKKNKGTMWLNDFGNEEVEQCKEEWNKSLWDYYCKKNYFNIIMNLGHNKLRK